MTKVAAEQCFRWAYLGLNQGPPACEAGALPLSYTPGNRPRNASGRALEPARGTPSSRRTEWEGFEPSRRVNPAHTISSRAPSAARTPLPAASQYRTEVPAGNAPQRFSRCERFFATAGTCAGRGGSRSFPLAPSASRSRLKLRRGTEAFRGNGTPAEWTKRQAFGHFFFGSRRRRRRVAEARVERRFALFPLRAPFRVSSDLRAARRVPLDSLSHRTLSRKRTKLRRGVGSPSGPRHASEAEEATESRSVHFVFRQVSGGRA